MSRLVLSALALILLAGCTVGPDFRPPPPPAGATAGIVAPEALIAS